MELEGSLASSVKLAAGTFLKPDESNSYRHILFPSNGLLHLQFHAMVFWVRIHVVYM
jgi:hypothetical protein